MSSSPCSEWESICRRAGGRRRYNARRRWAAEMRLFEVARLLNEVEYGRGYQTRIAKLLGVSRGTICRDIARLKRVYWGGRVADERHRAEMRRQRRIRDEDRWLRKLIAVDPDWAARYSGELVPVPETTPDEAPPYATHPTVVSREQPTSHETNSYEIQVPRRLDRPQRRVRSRYFPEPRRRYS